MVKKFKWLRDFEKVFIVHIAVAFWWVICWLGITWITTIWVDLPNDNPIILFLGIVALHGFVVIMVHGIWILIVGLYKSLREDLNS